MEKPEISNTVEICFFDEIKLHLNGIKYSIAGDSGKEWVEQKSFKFWQSFFDGIENIFISINGELFDSKCAASHFAFSINPHAVELSLISINNTRLAQKLLMSGDDIIDTSLIEITNHNQTARIIAKINKPATSLVVTRPHGMRCIERCLVIETIYCMISPEYPKVFKINTDNSIAHEEMVR